jgi:hypothetical protein
VRLSSAETVVDVALAAGLVWLIACAKPGPTQPPDNVPDTTSHAVIWHSDIIGFGGSVAHDVAVINENNIWVVGRFYVKDSTGKIDSLMYNVMRWDGTKWNPMNLYFEPFNSVFAFGADDIWLASEAPHHWDGHTMTTFDVNGIANGRVLKYWGTSSSDLYMSGDNGNFMHYDGQSFSAIPTGVHSEFSDLYGYSGKVYVVSYYYDNQILPSGVFLYQQEKFQFLFPSSSDSTRFRYLLDSFGVWVSPLGTVWVVTGTNVFKPFINHSPIPNINPSQYSTSCIRGTSDADVWVGGGSGFILHFNGATWMTYPDLILKGPEIDYQSMAVTGSTVVLVGTSPFEGNAVVTIGKHIPSP